MANATTYQFVVDQVNSVVTKAEQEVDRLQGAAAIPNIDWDFSTFWYNSLPSSEEVNFSSYIPDTPEATRGDSMDRGEAPDRGETVSYSGLDSTANSTRPNTLTTPDDTAQSAITREGTVTFDSDVDRLDGVTRDKDVIRGRDVSISSVADLPIDVPQLNIPAFVFNPEDYLSDDLLQRYSYDSDFFDDFLDAKLQTFINAQSYFINESVQDALFEQTRERDLQTLNDSLDAVDRMKARTGFPLPNSMQLSARNDLISKYMDMKSDRNSEITALIAERAHDGVKHSVDAGIKMEDIRAQFQLGFGRLYWQAAEYIIRKYEKELDAEIRQTELEIELIKLDYEAKVKNSALDLDYEKLSIDTDYNFEKLTHDVNQAYENIDKQTQYQYEKLKHEINAEFEKIFQDASIAYDKLNVDTAFNYTKLEQETDFQYERLNTELVQDYNKFNKELELRFADLRTKLHYEYEKLEYQRHIELEKLEAEYDFKFESLDADLKAKYENMRLEEYKQKMNTALGNIQTNVDVWKSKYAGQIDAAKSAVEYYQNHVASTNSILNDVTTVDES